MRTNIWGCPLTFKCVRYIASTLTSTLTRTHTHYIHITLKHKQCTTYITYPQMYMPHSHIHTWMDNDVHQQMNVYWKRSSCIYTGHYVVAGNDQVLSLLAKCITFYFNITQFIFWMFVFLLHVHWVIDFQSLRSQTVVLSTQPLALFTLLRQPLPVLIVFFVLSPCFIP